MFEGRYRLDFAHPSTKTAIELDGFKAHSSTRQIANDRRREREVRNAGWEFIRFGGHEIHHDVYGCVAETYQFIARRTNAPATNLAEATISPALSLKSVHYKPAQVKVLFIEEFASNGEGKSFYSADSVLFFRTREVFSEVFGASWKTPEEFLRFFREQGYYRISLCNAPKSDLDPQAQEKFYSEGVPLLVKQLVDCKPE